MAAWTDGLKIVALGTVICVAPALLSAPADAARAHEHIAAVHGASSHGGAEHMSRNESGRKESGGRFAGGSKRPDWSVRVISAHATMEFGGRHGGYGMHAHPMHAMYFSSYLPKHGFSKTGKARYAMRGGYSYGSYGYGGGLQCVPFARAASGIELKGNAANWWDAAAGVYDRGSRPEPGSVLNFRAIGRMRLGHVAVVAAVVNSRTIEVDHANWAGSYGGVSRGVSVVDVSPNNDWSEVRVAMGHNGELGTGVYPTYGFIYDRPDSGTMLANNTRARRSLPVQSDDEVAEAPARPRVFIPASYSR
jgi:surface antigen